LKFNVTPLYSSGLLNDNVFKESFFSFCQKAFEEKDQPAHSNMWDEDWKNNSNTLLYHLYISKRLSSDTGETFILMDNEEIIAVSSVYISEFDKNVAIGGVRSWVDKKYRGKFILGRYVLPHQLAWARERRLKTIALTFNEYNKRLLPYFRRSGVGIKKNRNPNSLFYTGLHEIDFPCEVQYTKQWIIYSKIDEEYTPDWHAIKWKDRNDIH
jgi:GNAT superfamily N-acetyltransferase